MNIKKYILLFSIITTVAIAQPKYVLQTKIDLATFEKIKKIILKKGLTKTYRNFDGNNPYYKTKYYELFLGSDIGQENINNDPTKSDFNELQVYSKKYTGIDLSLVAVRIGDLEAKKHWITNEMKEGFVYVEINKKIPLEVLENEIEIVLTEFKLGKK